jgi:hypothetical protein
LAGVDEKGIGAEDDPARDTAKSAGAIVSVDEAVD